MPHLENWGGAFVRKDIYAYIPIHKYEYFKFFLYDFLDNCILYTSAKNLFSILETFSAISNISKFAAPLFWGGANFKIVRLPRPLTGIISWKQNKWYSILNQWY